MSLRVGLFAPLNDVATATGTGQYVRHLLSALVDIETDRSPPDIEYAVIVGPDAADWVPAAVRDHVERHEIERDRRRPFDEWFERLSLDVVHFLVPVYARTDRPTLFNPFDLRHLRYPDHLDSEELGRRRRHYPEGCTRATVVDTLSQAVADGVVAEYGTDPERVQPVPMGPALAGADRVTDDLLADVERAYDLPDSFALFPANTWPHKNHERLVAAIEYVEDTYGTAIPLVCTGTRDTPSVPESHRVDGVPDHGRVRDVGFVERDHLRALYARSRLLVYPSLYEGGGLPVIEAWQFDTPVVCSAIPPLREKGGDAAAYFDPESVSEMGDTIHAVWTDAERRERLVARGRARRGQFTWDRTACIYHALYRKTAGQELSESDHRALGYPDES
jgi:glycosyltransferase involved in cell wall biosynthesis